MAFRQALQLAACGLAGGSAAVLFSAVAVGKQRPGGDAEPRSPELPAWAGDTRSGLGLWDPNWDRREPLSLINLRKRNVESGEEELASKLDHYKAKATRHIFLIRHSQYYVDGSLEKDRILTPLGREQAELTGLRLASLGLKFDRIVHSSMTRAVETTDIIGKHLPGVCKVSTDLLREGAPIEPDPPVSHWKPEAVTTPNYAPSSITKMEPGLRLPSGTTYTAQMLNRKKTVMKSSSVMPTSSATSCAEHCSFLRKVGSVSPSTTAASPTW
ncbi:serine/threonine-protein phosphatase PGAM5, mitochondrial isoform X3 [Otolemur garnettii]|uniref:serine/threonine-protein phosphatase PGAM5, mitochondrial isoform X3 n=1 Tax=Otolemur garnettii TaxID=30611 RepID=UPI000C7F02DF|nr:serine/threonine-protein phosphatase PGAM5, mitochondrial isoform X3 [Otolemur garnettii]